MGFFDVSFWVVTLDFIGKICVGIMALLVHDRIKTEKKIDGMVVKEMNTERRFGIGALLLFTLSYLLSLI